MLWPGAVLRAHCTTVFTLVLKDGILRVTAVRMPSQAITGDQKSDTSAPTLKQPNTIRKKVHLYTKKHRKDINEDGPFLLLTSLRVLHHPHEEPVSVYLHLTSARAALYYSINCNAGECSQ